VYHLKSWHPLILTYVGQLDELRLIASSVFPKKFFFIFGRGSKFGLFPKNRILTGVHSVGYNSGSMQARRMKFYTAIGYWVPNIPINFYPDPTFGCGAVGPNMSKISFGQETKFGHPRLDSRTFTVVQKKFLYPDIAQHVPELWDEFQPNPRWKAILTIRYQLGGSWVFTRFAHMIGYNSRSIKARSMKLSGDIGPWILYVHTKFYPNPTSDTGAVGPNSQNRQPGQGKNQHLRMWLDLYLGMGES